MRFYIVLFFLIVNCTLFGQKRNLLQNATLSIDMKNILAKGTEWVDLPSYSNRKMWESLSPLIHEKIILKGEKSLNFNWDIVKATDYLEFIRSGNRAIMENPENKRLKNLQNLILAELVEGKKRFLDQIIDGVWALCEQSTWIHSAHLPSQKTGAGLPNPDDIIIDLGSARIAAILAWTHYYFESEFDKVSPFIAARIRKEVKKRILTPYYNRNDMWWMGFTTSFVNNWNVWVNYNVLQCILLLETDYDVRLKNVYKAIKSIDQFLNYYKDDGGCDEGASYWKHAGGKLFESLELLHKATNKILNIYNNELIKNIGRYIYRVYIHAPYFVNFADAAAKIEIPSGLVYRYGKAINDTLMQGFGSFYAQRQNMDNSIPEGTIETVIRDLFDADEIVHDKAIEPLIGECWLPETQVAVTRDKPHTSHGFYFASKGGNNNESHNHNDVGSFILYYNGLPAIIDVGLGTYTRKTFSAERYKIWIMQSGYHNLPIINGEQQAFGNNYAARNVKFYSTENNVIFSADIAGSYPQKALVNKWTRTYNLERGEKFTIIDDYVMKETNGRTSLIFMTSCNAVLKSKGLIELIGENFTLYMNYDSNDLEARLENITLDDKRLQNVWGMSLIRIILDLKNPDLSHKCTIEIHKSKYN